MDFMEGHFQLHTLYPIVENGQADYESIWVGPCVGIKAPDLDWLVFKKSLEYQPDVIFIYGWGMRADDEYKANHISLIALYLIRKLLGIKIVALLFDQAFGNFNTSDNLVRFCDFAFTHEHKDVFWGYTLFPQKHIAVSPICTSRFISRPFSPRDIDLLFIGGIGGRYPKERAEGIQILRSRGLNVETPGGRSEMQEVISNEDYVKFTKRAKIVLNWTRHISGRWHQAKGRIFEVTLAGAMLLCEECAPVNRYFRPYVDYVPFSNTADLIEKASYYLENEHERLKMARGGHNTAIKKYRADIISETMVRDMMLSSYFEESEAIEGLERNASANELRVAWFFKNELQKYPEFNQSVIEEAVGIVEKANWSFVRKLHWRRQRTRWIMRSLKGMPLRILRKLIPASITRKRVKAGLNSLYSVKTMNGKNKTQK